QRQHDDDREARDGEAVVGPDGVQAGQDVAEELEDRVEDLADELEQGILRQKGVAQHARPPSCACTRTGTRSTPWGPKGRQRTRRRAVRPRPRQNPWRVNASTA